MKEKDLVSMSDHVKILQKLNELYENNPTEEAAQIILDFVDNELPKGVYTYDNDSDFNFILVFSLITTVISTYWVENIINLIPIFAISVILAAVIKIILDTRADKTSIFRYYFELNTMRESQKKQDAIAALETKYFSKAEQ